MCARTHRYEGRVHSGIDDARNTAAICRDLLRRGVPFRLSHAALPPPVADRRVGNARAHGSRRKHSGEPAEGGCPASAATEGGWCMDGKRRALVVGAGDGGNGTVAMAHCGEATAPSS